MGEKDINFTEEYTPVANKHMQRWFIYMISFQGNANLNFNEISVHTYQNKNKNKNKWYHQVREKMCSNWIIHTLLIAIENDKTTMENSLSNSYKTKYAITV